LQAAAAADPARAWNDLMLQNRVAANDGKCQTSMAKVAELARRLGITGTPVVFFATGRRLQGYAPPDSFERMLAEASRR
jgi:thiol:disulfide interchange protein DsbC